MREIARDVQKLLGAAPNRDSLDAGICEACDPLEVRLGCVNSIARAKTVDL